MEVVKVQILPVIKQLRKGENVAFALEKITSVRSTCYNVALATGRVFKTNVDREQKIVKVKRTK